VPSVTVPEQHGTRPLVSLDGTALREEIERLVERVVVDSSLHAPDLVEVRLRDHDRDVLRRSGVRIGSVLDVEGSRTGEGKLEKIASVEVTTLEHDFGAAGSVAVIRGYDVAHRLRRGRRTASYNDMTDGDVVRQVARRAGLQVGTVDDDGPTQEHVAQLNATDWDFLLARGRETGHEVVVQGGKLHWRTPAPADDAPDAVEGYDDPRERLQLTLGTNLVSLRPRLSASDQVPDVVVRGWDMKAKQAVVGRAGASSREAGAAVGPGELARTFDVPTHTVVDRPVSDQGVADATAGACAEALASAHAEAEGVALGDPRLLAGAAVVLAMAGWPYDGKYVVTSARHVFDGSGYKTHLTCSGRNDRSLWGLVARGSGAATSRASGPPVPGVVVGVVTANDDPDSLGRVKVKFPWLADDYESWWVRTASLGAGPDRGAVWLPEVNDEVLVAFEHGDTRSPVVVGCLWNGVDKPPLGDDLVDGTTGAVKRRGFVSRKNHRVVLLDDDGDSGIALLTGDDKLKLSLDSTATTISVKADGTVEISGSQGVRITSDGAISIQAGQTLELKGKTGVTIDGGPKVDVDGSVIQLN
jgi:phage protein D